MGQADDMCITVAWDQAPHWGKKEKKIGERSESGGLSPLSRTPLG